MTDTISTLLLLIPALPLLAAVVTALAGPKLLKSFSHLPTVIALAGSFLCSSALALQVQSLYNADGGGPNAVERVYRFWTWAKVGNLDLEIVLRADALTAVMLAMVTFVSTLVAIFSVGYMKGDRGYWRFFSYFSLFVFSMTMLVAASNFLLLFVFWEGVGLCSYLLIGFWYQKREAVAAGKKAFLVNRVGDFGFLLAMFLIWTNYGTLDFHDDENVRPAFAAQSVDVAGAAEDDDVAATVEASRPLGIFAEDRVRAHDYVAGGVGLAICLLLMLGACGKSAQFPLHVWLPDAMEGPTPVSALIHAATMVTAGVYMVARCTPLFAVSPDAQLVVAVIGGFTALLAALIALTQFDLKRVLAYSTISQLGYMFLALGTGTMAGISAGMFHLLTHAFFKALLFLGAGSVMHAMGNVIDMRRFGGLKQKMPITHATFAVGCLALAGVIPLAGFWSKDAILSAVHDKAHMTAEPPGEELAALGPSPITESAQSSFIGDPHVVYVLLYWSAVVTAFLTAFYTFRAYFMTFHGDERIPREAGHHAHESPPVMWGPLAALAVCAAIAGLVGLGFNQSGILAGVPSLAATTHAGEFHFSVAALSTFVALSGIGAAAYFYLGDRNEIRWLAARMNCEKMPRFRAMSPYRFSSNKFYFDEIYFVLIVAPLRGLAWLCFCLDRLLVDGLVNFVGRVPPAIGGMRRKLQTGLTPYYALAMIVGILIMVAVRVLWASG